MAVYTIQTPNNDNWSKNPVKFTVGTTAVVTSVKLLSFSVEIQDYVTGSWEEIYTGIQRFNSNNESEIEISSICDAHLEYYVAKPYDTSLTTTKYVIWKKQARNFRVKFFESDDTGTLITSSEFYVIKGGVAKEAWNKDNINSQFFDFATSGNAPMLHWAEDNFAYRDQGCLFVSFYMAYGATVTSIKQTLFSTVAVPAITTYSLSNHSRGDVIILFADISNLNSNIYSAKYYLDNSGTPVSQELVFTTIPRTYSYSRTYAYINSLGGTDIIYMPYNLITQSEQIRETFSVINNDSYTLEVSAESFNMNQFEEHVTSVDTGELSYTAQDRMREMALAPLRFELLKTLYGLKYIPVNVLTKKNSLINNKSRVPVPVYFEIVRAVKNSQYTPLTESPQNRLVTSDWENIYPPVEDIFYMLLEPADNPAQLPVDINTGVALFDFGDGEPEIKTGSFTHTYSNDNYRRISAGYFVQNRLIELNITSHGKIGKMWGTLPWGLQIMKLNNQHLYELPPLPKTLTQLEADSNLLDKIPELNGTVLEIISLSYNDIDNYTTNYFPVALSNVYLDGNKLPVSVVNAILQALDHGGLTNGEVIINNQTPAAAPTGAGATAKTSLIGKGWTVTTD